MRGFDRVGAGVADDGGVDDRGASSPDESTLQPDASSAMRAFVLSPRSANGVTGRAPEGVAGRAVGPDGVTGRAVGGGVVDVAGRAVGGGVDGVARAIFAGGVDRVGGGVDGVAGRAVGGGVAGVARAPGGGVLDRTCAGAGVWAGADAGGWLPSCSPSGESTLQPEARSAMRALVSSPSRRRVRSSSGTGRP